jgi:hypothetical protein
MKSLLRCFAFGSSLLALSANAAAFSETLDVLDHRSDCIRVAESHELRGDSIVRVCQKATMHSSECIRVSWSMGLKQELLVKSCDDRPSQFVASCLRTGYFEKITGDALARLCRSVREDVTDCIRAAVDAGLTVEEVVQTCGATPAA